MNRDDKRAVVERLVAQIKESKAMIVTDYRGLSVSQTAEIRDALRPSGATFHVAKNTLARMAAEEAERPHLVEFLQGPTAIAFISDDPAAAAKKLSEVARQTKLLAVRGGVMNGHTLTADQIRMLGDLPPREILLAQVVGTVAGPLQGTVGVLAAPLRDIVGLLDSYIAKRQEAEAA
jgi:large subunit ribosomal protein L10